jgi:hypothetical protein
MGVAPHIGRVFAHGEEQPGNDLYSVVISHKLWQERFGADRNILGKKILLDTTPYTVIGVAPPGFRFGYQHNANADAWAPLESCLDRFKQTMRAGKTCAMRCAPPTEIEISGMFLRPIESTRLP